MKTLFTISVVALITLGATRSLAQETPSAKATRKKLQQKITVDFKDVGTKAVFEEIKGEMDPAVAFKIDNASGISNNTKLSYSAKNKTVEEILNDLSDKFDFGWFVKSDVKDRNDGFVIIRKAKEKERGHEGGKEPKKSSAPSPGAGSQIPADSSTGFASRIVIDKMPNARVIEKLTIEN